MLSENEFAKLLVSWRKQYGIEIKGNYCVPINGNDRTAMYRNLIKTLIEIYEYTEENLESAMVERKIMEASVNPASPKKKEWLLVAIRDWKNALDDFFPKEILEFDSSKLPKKEPRPEYDQVEYAKEDPRLAKDNPIDRSIFESMPPVNDPEDPEFAELLKRVIDE